MVNRKKSNLFHCKFSIPIALFWLFSPVLYASNSSVTECDILASNYHDHNRVAEGVGGAEVDTALAEPACKEAVANDPTNWSVDAAMVELFFSWAEQQYPSALPGFANAYPPSFPAPYDKYQYRHYTENGNDILISCSN